MRATVICLGRALAVVLRIERWRVWLALVVLVTAVSFQAAPLALAKSHGRYLAGNFGQGTVQRFTTGLANVGIGVYPVGGSQPVRRVAGRASPLRLTVPQARTAALGVWSRSGLSGASLDTWLARCA